MASKIKVLLISAISGLILGVVYAYNVKPVYVSNCTFVLEDNTPGSGVLGQYAGLASIAGVDVGGSSGGLFQGDNITALYKSRTMIQSALLDTVKIGNQTMLLIDRYISINNLKKKWKDNAELNNINFNKRPFSRIQDSVLSSIVDNINNNYLNVSKPDKKLSIIKVEVISPDEFFSKEFNDHIVKNVGDFYVSTKTKKSLDNLSILQRQTDSIKKVLSNAINTSASVSDATPNLNPTRQILRAPIQKSQLNADANKVILTQLVQNLELSKISLRKETPLIQLIDPPIFPLQKQKASRLKSGLIGLIIALFLTAAFLIYKQVIDNILNES